MDNNPSFNTIDLTPSWGEVGKLYFRLVESGETAAARAMRPDIAKALAAAEALRAVMDTLSEAQMTIVTRTMNDELFGESSRKGVPQCTK